MHPPGTQSQAPINQKRVDAFELENALNALDSQLQVLADELGNTEGKTLSGLIASLTGSRQRQIDKIHSLQSELQQRRDEMHRQLVALNEEVAALSPTVQMPGQQQITLRNQSHPETTVLNGAAEEQKPNSGATTDPQELIKRIEAAMAACEEARKDLLDEMATTGGLGRCRIAEANRPLKMLAGRVRKNTAEECAERVRQSLRRLHRRLVAAAEAQPQDREIHFMCEEIGRLAERFSGRDLTSKLGGEDSGTWLHDRLQTVGMLLEQDLAAAKLHMNDPHRSSDEILGPPPIPPASLGGDAVQVAPTAQE